MPIVTPPDLADFDTSFAKEEKTLEIVKDKVANGGRVIIYTSWTRTDSQDKLLRLLVKLLMMQALEKLKYS